MKPYSTVKPTRGILFCLQKERRNPRRFKTGMAGPRVLVTLELKLVLFFFPRLVIFITEKSGQADEIIFNTPLYKKKNIGF